MLQKFKEKKTLIGISSSIFIVSIYGCFSKNTNNNLIIKFNNILKKYKNISNIDFSLEKNQNQYKKNNINIKSIVYSPFKDLSKIRNKHENTWKYLNEIKANFPNFLFIVNNSQIDFTNANEDILAKNIQDIRETLNFFKLLIKDPSKTFFQYSHNSIEFKIPFSLENNVNIVNYKKLIINFCENYNFKFIKTII